MKTEKLLLTVSHSPITQRVGVMDELLLDQKNTSMGDAWAGIEKYSNHGKEIVWAII